MGKLRAKLEIKSEFKKKKLLKRFGTLPLDGSCVVF